MTDEQRIKTLEQDYYAEKQLRVVLEGRVKYVEDQLALLRTELSTLKRKLNVKP